MIGRKRSLCFTYLLVLVCVLGYKKDYGFGFMFKYDPNFRERREAETNLTQQIKNVINHYKQDDPIGLPPQLGGTVVDPMRVPNLTHRFSVAKMSFRDIEVHGLSKFRLMNVHSNLSDLKISLGVSIDQLQVLGNYLMTAWISRSTGRFNVAVINVWVQVDGELIVDEEGFLQVREIKINLSFENLKMNFENLGFLGKFFQSIINSVGRFIFDSIKPFIWQEVEVKIRGILNKEARNIPQQFPNSINPVDMALASARHLIKQRGLDPSNLPDYETDTWSKFELQQGVLHGLSSIRRTGSILLGFERNTIHLGLHLGVENLKGSYRWSWGMSNFLSRSGILEFNVEQASAEVRLLQPVNLNNKTMIEKIELVVGPVTLLSNGAGAVDYILEMFFNIVPNVFRQQIVDAVEYPICRAIEDELENLNIESLIEENI